MTRLIDSQSITIDGPGKLGRAMPQIADAGTLLTPENCALVGGARIGSSYRVPTAKRLTAQCLWLGVQMPSDIAAQIPGTALSLGKVEILYGGALRWECRVHGALANTTPGADEMVGPAYTANKLFNFGDGFIVPAGTELLVRVSPSLKIPVRWSVEFFGSSNQCAHVVTTTTAAGQTVFSYTPATDWTVTGMVMGAQTSGQVAGQMRLDFQGLPLWESPYCGADDSAPVFGDDGDTISSGYGMGVLALPMEDVVFGEGSELSAFAHAWAAVGQKFQIAVIGDETDVGGGSPGSQQYSRSRVVNT